MENQQTNESPIVSGRARSFFKWILVAGLVIVVNLFFYFAIDAFYQSPKYENFCKNEQVRPLVKTQEECVSKGGQWTEMPADKSIIVYQDRQNAPIAVPAPGETVNGYCNEDFTCQKGYEDARNVYNRNVFVILVILGVALVVGSYFVAAYGAVSLGFALAGILSLIIGSMRYWSDMDERVRVVVLGLALAALIWYGIKKFRE
jgi:hypothetical protein